VRPAVKNSYDAELLYWRTKQQKQKSTFRWPAARGWFVWVCCLVGAIAFVCLCILALDGAFGFFRVKP